MLQGSRGAGKGEQRLLAFLGARTSHRGARAPRRPMPSDSKRAGDPQANVFWRLASGRQLLGHGLCPGNLAGFSLRHFGVPVPASVAAGVLGVRVVTRPEGRGGRGQQSLLQPGRRPARRHRTLEQPGWWSVCSNRQHRQTPPLPSLGRPNCGSHRDPTARASGVGARGCLAPAWGYVPSRPWERFGYRGVIQPVDSSSPSPGGGVATLRPFPAPPTSPPSSSTLPLRWPSRSSLPLLLPAAPPQPPPPGTPLPFHPSPHSCGSPSRDWNQGSAVGKRSASEWKL